MNLNLTILIGRAGRDPEVKELESGQKIAKFIMATNRYFTNKNNERVVITDWHNIVCWGRIAELVEKYVIKGMEITVVGSNTNRSYEDKEGNKKYYNEIICDSLQLGRKPGEKTTKDNKAEEKEETSPIIDDEDDLPF